MTPSAPAHRLPEDAPHPRFGKHSFTVAHSAGQAWALIVFAGVCLVPTLYIYLFSGNELLNLLGMVPALIGSLSVVIGLVQLVRSQTQTHVYETGIVQKGPWSTLEMSFARMTEATLDLTEQYGTLNMRFRLRQGLLSISFWDAASGVEIRTRQQIDAIVQHVADRLPRDVPLKGMHNISRE